MEPEKKKLIRPDYLLIPFQLISDRDLEPMDRLLYGVIYWYEHLKDGRCYASNQSLAAILFSTTRAIQNSLNKLEDRGYIFREYKDEAKRNRTQITAKIAFRNERTVGDRQPGERTVGDRRERTVGDQSSNTRDRRNTAPAKQAHPFSFPEYLQKMHDHAARHVQIIAFYFAEKKLTFETALQAQSAIRRHLRAAKELAPFTDKQITGAAKKAAKEYPEWTIETLLKVLTR